MISPRDIEWTAGFLEGEGSFRYRPYQGRTSEVSAPQLQRAPLEKLQRLFGGHIWIRRRGSGHQDMWVWYLHGARAIGLMMTLYSLMSPGRQAQIRGALSAWRMRQNRQRKSACP